MYKRQQGYLKTLDLIRDRFHTLKDFATLGRAYLADDYRIEDKPLQKNVLKFPELKNWLPLLAERYEQLEIFTADSAEQLARDLAEECGVKPGVIINGMRTIVTGQLAGPSITDVLTTIGRERIVQRLRKTGTLF